MKKAYPMYDFGNYLDMARLVQPRDMKYKNRSRLESEFTKKIIMFQVRRVVYLIGQH